MLNVVPLIKLNPPQTVLVILRRMRSKGRCEQRLGGGPYTVLLHVLLCFGTLIACTAVKKRHILM